MSTIYVPSGGDIQSGISKIRPSDRLVIGPGIFEQWLVPGSIPSGVPGSPTVIAAEIPGTVVIRPPVGGGSGGLTTGPIRYVAFDSIITDAANVPDAAWELTGSDLVLLNCEGRNAHTVYGSGFMFIGSRILLQDCVSESCGDLGGLGAAHGAYVSTSDNVIQGFKVLNHRDGYGVQIYNSAGNCNRNRVFQLYVGPSGGSKAGAIVSSGQGHVLSDFLIEGCNGGVYVQYGAFGALVGPGTVRNCRGVAVAVRDAVDTVIDRVQRYGNGSNEIENSGTNTVIIEGPLPEPGPVPPDPIPPDPGPGPGPVPPEKKTKKTKIKMSIQVEATITERWTNLPPETPEESSLQSSIRRDLPPEILLTTPKPS